MGEQEITGRGIDEKSTIEDVVDAEQEIDAREGSLNTLRLYLKEISVHPVLTREQETEIFNHYSHVKRELNKETAPKERRALEREKAAIYQKIAVSNLRFVIKIAKRYRQYAPFLDLIGEGNVGLMQAIDKYNYRTGNRFLSYAVWWIRQAITSYISRNKEDIRNPAHRVERTLKSDNVRHKFFSLKGRYPTEDELENLVKGSKTTYRQAPRYVNIDERAFENEDGSMESAIADPRIDIEHMFAEEDLQRSSSKMLRGVSARLGPKARKILEMRYGLNGYNEMTLREVGYRLRLSRERIRQIECKALSYARGYMARQRMEEISRDIVGN